MAGTARLSRRGRRLLALLVAVLLLHLLALQWLARELEAVPLLRPLATPLFTRLLRPEAAVVAPKPVAHIAPRPTSRRVAVAAVQSKPAIPAKPAASAPAAPASAAVTPSDPSPAAPQEATATATAA